MTTNDLKANELLVLISRLQPEVSEYVRAGQLGRAITAHSFLEDAVRKLGWRLIELDERKTP